MSIKFETKNNSSFKTWIRVPRKLSEGGMVSILLIVWEEVTRHVLEVLSLETRQEKFLLGVKLGLKYDEGNKYQ